MSCPCTNSWDAFRRLSRFALELSMSGFAPECSILMYGCRCLSHLFLLQQQEVIPVGTRERIQYQPPPLAGLLHLRASHFWAAITWTLRDQQILAALPLTGA